MRNQGSRPILSPDEFEVTKPDPVREHAQRIVNAMNRNRHIIKRADENVLQCDIAAEVGLSQSMVSRVLANRERYVSSPVPVEEVVARYVLGHIAHDRMMDDLMARTYEDGEVPAAGYDAYVRGSWDEITAMRDLGLLAEKDFRQLAAKRRTA